MKKQTVKVASLEKDAFLAALSDLGIDEYSTQKQEAGGYQFQFKADSGQMFSLGVRFAERISEQAKKMENKQQ